MGLPDSESLLTRRGVVTADDIRAGDRTIGACGEWTTVRAVHRQSDVPLRRYILPDGVVLTCTSEHKWVIFHSTGNWQVVPVADASPYATLRLAADASPLPDVDDETLRLLVKTFVGFGISCGNMALQEGRRRELIASGDFPPDFPDTDTSLRALLRDAGHRSEALTVMLELPTEVCAGFLHAMTEVATRLTADGRDSLVCGSDLIRDTAAAAIYRARLRSAFGEAAGCGAYLVPHSAEVLVRDLRDGGMSRSDVWCVTTDSGTFTAWGDSGPYLTGGCSA